MKSKLLGGVALAASLTMAATVVLAQAPAPSPSTTERTGVNSTLGIAPPTQDFVTQAAISDMAEIESSKLALAKGDAKNKTFAEKMIRDHTETSAEPKALVSGGKVKAILPAAMDSAHQSRVDKLKSLNGATSRRPMTRCRSPRTRTPYRCSSAIPRAARIPN